MTHFSRTLPVCCSASETATHRITKQGSQSFLGVSPLTWWGGLASLGDPESYTSWDLGPWYFNRTVKFWTGWRAKRIATPEPPGRGLGFGLMSHPSKKVRIHSTLLIKRNTLADALECKNSNTCRTKYLYNTFIIQVRIEVTFL